VIRNTFVLAYAASCVSISFDAYAQTAANNDSCSGTWTECLAVATSGATGVGDAIVASTNKPGGTAINALNSGTSATITPIAITAQTTGGEAIYGNDTTTGDGIFGQSSSGNGVAASSETGNGVVGATSSTSTTTNAGVLGSGPTGVLGDGSTYGVYGTSPSGYPSAGVYGTSSAMTEGQGVVGSVTGSESIGVLGETDVGYGIYGIASGTSGVASIGYATGQYGYGIEGIASQSTGVGVWGNATDGGVGVHGSCTGENCLAASFSGGNVNLTGYSYLYNGTTCVGGECTVSDRRLKKNIEPLAGAIDKLLQLKGVTYEWNALDEPFKKPGVHTGVIAQDVEKVFPEWVTEDSKGIKAVNPDPRTMLGVTVEAFRTQQAEIEDLKAEVKALRDAHGPVVSMNANGLGMGVGGLAIAGALFMSRRKRSDGVQG
jgi:hypothetical protein